MASNDEVAERRTDWAEDRTLLANERTYAGWLRTGLASVGLGLGFQAIFKETDPVWAAKAVASVFILIGVFIFWGAWRNAREVQKHLHAHAATAQTPRRLGMFTALFIFGSLALAVVLWLL